MKDEAEDLEYIHFRTTGIDLVKLRQQKEWSLILRMLRVFNDISLPPSISFLIQFAPESPELKPVKAAVNHHLLKWRLSMATEAMKNVINPLTNHANDSSHEVWDIIRNDASLSQAWRDLASEKYKAEREKARKVRNQLFAHYDQEPIEPAFEQLLQLCSTDNTNPIGWHLQSTGDNGRISRNVLIDEVLNLAWYEIYGIKVTKDGPNNDEELEKQAKTILEFLSLVHNFINGVVIAYLEKHGLTTIAATPPWLAVGAPDTNN